MRIMPDIPGFKEMVQRPKFAWPTAIYFLITAFVFITSTTLACLSLIPAIIGVIINAVCCYAFFTVVHDSGHKAISTNKYINNFFGIVSALFFGPGTLFDFFVWRYIHNQHHAHTNNETRDPDFWAGQGRAWQLPLYWITTDLHYSYIYIKRFSTLPLYMRISSLLQMTLMISAFVTLCYLGYWREAILYWLIPGRIAIPFLAYVLDYLPHKPYEVTSKENPFRATNIRIGHEKLLNILLMGHNYHLAHHLFPQVPFYRYKKVWKAGETYFLQFNPRIVDLTKKHR